MCILALTDDYEGVRCEALKILAAMAETDPEYQVEVESGGGGLTGQTIRLVDDVFSRTCQAINDVRETVRVLAAKLIGDIRGVSQVSSAFPPFIVAQLLLKYCCGRCSLSRPWIRS